MAEPRAGAPPPLAPVGPPVAPPPVAGPGPPSPGGPSSITPCGVTAAPAAWQHVVWIVMENKAYEHIIGAPDAPFANALAARCGLATAFVATAHPSLPNYIAMTSGATQGVTADISPAGQPLAAPSI